MTDASPQDSDRSHGSAEPDEALLDRLFAQEAQTEERQRYERWRDSSPQQARAIDVLEHAVRSFGAVQVPEYDSNVAESVAQAAMGGNARVSRPHAKAGPRQRTLPRHLLSGQRTLKGTFLCASVIVLIVVGAVVSRMSRTSDAVRLYQTASGQRSTVRLADGSRVILAPATTVRVRHDTVTVDGAAYFQVSHDPGRPFVVQTRDVVARVLGTTFVVRQYATDRNGGVAVEEGRVTLRARHASRRADVSAAETVLTARMLGQVTDTIVSVTTGIAVNEYTGWIQGRLVFKETPLQDVVTELARAYGVQIRIADPALARGSVTIAVSINRESLPEVLRQIGFVTRAHYTYERQVFVLVPGRDATQVPQEEQLRERQREQRREPYQRFPEPEKQYGR